MRLLTKLRDAVAKPHRAAGLFLCQSPCSRVLAHFERLQRESAGYVDWALFPDNGHLNDPRGDEPYRHAAYVMPRRFAAAQACGQLISGAGMLDVAIIPAVLAAAHEHVWVIEFDVDYAGHWSAMFRRFARNRADVLTTTLVRRDKNPDWCHWAAARAPASHNTADWMRDFHPMMRLSRRFAAAYAAATETGDWAGHYEFTIPNIATHLGFRIEDMAAPDWRRPFAPALYHNTPQDPHLGPGTFIWRPARDAYYHENRQQFTEPARLYHPVKPAPPPVLPADVALIVPVCNAAGWIATMIDAYAALGLTPVYILDARSTDESAEILAARGVPVMVATGSHARVESLLFAAVPALTATWILRFDDDELPSRGLLAWLRDNLPALQTDAVGFPRQWVASAGDDEWAVSHCNAASLAAGGQPNDDRQYRLFRREQVTMTEDLHTPGFISATRAEAPADALIYHFDWLVRDRASRAKKVEAYEQQCPGSGHRFEHYYLPELHDPAFYALSPLTDSTVAAVAARLAAAGRNTPL